MATVSPFQGILPKMKLAEAMINDLEFNSFPLIIKDFEHNLAQNRIEKDDAPSIYIYQSKLGLTTSTGVWAITPFTELEDGTIRIHEKIEKDRSDLILAMLRKSTLDFNPILLVYVSPIGVQECIEEITSREPHLQVENLQKNFKISLWKVQDKKTIEELTSFLKKKYPIYLADGHHRADAFLNWLKENNLSSINYKADPSKKIPGFSSIYFSLDQIQIKPYHRFLLLNKPANFLLVMEKIKYYFDIFPIQEIHLPQTKGDFILACSNSKNYRIRFKKELLPEKVTVLERLDSIILEEFIFNRILELRSNKPLAKLGYLGGDHAEKTMEEKLKSGQAHMGFLLFPPSFEEIKEVANLGLFMPPKSTYFEPKIPSGFIIQNLQNLNLKT